MYKVFVYFLKQFETKEERDGEGGGKEESESKGEREREGEGEGEEFIFKSFILIGDS
jgi:hypothetical protein